MLSNVGTFNTEVVRRAWDGIEREKRKNYRTKHPAAHDVYDVIPYTYIRELWTTYIIVETEGKGGTSYVKIPYTVSNGNDVTFGDPTPVEQVWKDEKGKLSATEKTLLKDVLVKSV
jgi:hypothetical protein